MLGDSEIRGLIEKWLNKQPIPFGGIKEIVKKYLKDRLDVDFDPEQFMFEYKRDEMLVSMRIVVDWYSVEYGLSVLRDKDNQIIKILWGITSTK